MFDVAVILVNYNSGTLTADCIQSVIEKTNPSIRYQIIVADNCSRYDEYLAMKESCEALGFENLQIVRSRVNTGFGGGNMFAVQYANAKYLAFINNDTVFKNDCLGIILQTMQNNSSIGIAGAQAFDGTDKFMVSLDHFASPVREIIGRVGLEKTNSKEYPDRRRTYETPLRVNYVPGSFMFLRAEDFYAVGGFDNNLFLYYEETDLCKRLRKIGRDAYLVPTAEYVHYHGASTKKSIVIKKELKISLLYIMRKHYGISGYFSVHIFLIIKYFFSGLLKPKHFPLFLFLLRGAPLTESLKQKQVVAEK